MYLPPDHIARYGACPISMVPVHQMVHPVVIRDEPHVYELDHLFRFRTNIEQRGALKSPMTRVPYEITDVQTVRIDGTRMFQYYVGQDCLRKFALAEGRAWVAAPDDPAWPPFPPDTRVSLPMPGRNSTMNEIARLLAHNHAARLARGADQARVNARREQERQQELANEQRARRWIEYNSLVLVYGTQPTSPEARSVHAFHALAYDHELHRMPAPTLTAAPQPLLQRRPRTTTTCRDVFRALTALHPVLGAPRQLPPLFQDLVAYPAVFDPYHADTASATAAFEYLLHGGGVALVPSGTDDVAFSEDERWARRRILVAAVEILGIMIDCLPAGAQTPPPIAPGVFDANRARLETSLLLARYTVQFQGRPLRKLASVVTFRGALMLHCLSNRHFPPTVYLDELDATPMALFTPLLALAPFQNLSLFQRALTAAGATTRATASALSQEEARASVVDALRALNEAGAAQGIPPMTREGAPDTVFGRFYHHHINLFADMLG